MNQRGDFWRCRVFEVIERAAINKKLATCRPGGGNPLYTSVEKDWLNVSWGGQHSNQGLSKSGPRSAPGPNGKSIRTRPYSVLGVLRGVMVFYFEIHFILINKRIVMLNMRGKN